MAAAISFEPSRFVSIMEANITAFVVFTCRIRLLTSYRRLCKVPKYMKVMYSKSIRETIGRNVTRYLEAQPDLKIPALAAKVGVKRQYIYAIKSGIVNVTIDKLEALARELNVETRDLLKEPKNGTRRRA